MTQFKTVEKAFEASGPERFTIGLANINTRVPDLEANRDRIAAAVEVFRDRGVNMAVFPEYCLSGCFWDDRAACEAHMSRAAMNQQVGWIRERLVPLLDDNLQYIVLNGAVDQPEAEKPYLNVTCVVDSEFSGLIAANTYKKIFLPGIEAHYASSGKDDRLVVDTPWGRFGFITCYDLCFQQLLQEYALVDQVDAIVAPSAWRSRTERHYPGMDAGSDHYYGFQWDTLLPAHALLNQIWMFGCNTVGRHELGGEELWGGSGVWAPSGIRLAQASHHEEELLIVRNIDIKGERKIEHADFSYAGDFQNIYRPIAGSRAFTRTPE